MSLENFGILGRKNKSRRQFCKSRKYLPIKLKQVIHTRRNDNLKLSVQLTYCCFIFLHKKNLFISGNEFTDTNNYNIINSAGTKKSCGTQDLKTEKIESSSYNFLL